MARPTRGALVLGCAVAMLAATERPADAHHPKSIQLRTQVSPAAADQTWFQLQMSRMELVLDDTLGDGAGVWTLELASRLRLSDAFGVRLRLPVHMVSLETDDERGLGDAALGLSWRAYEQDGLVVVGGVDAHVPLGDEDARLGSGAFALAPFVRANRGWDGWVVSAEAGVYAQVTNRDVARSAIDRFASTELDASAGVARSISRVRFGVGFRLLTALEPSDVAGDVFATVEPDIAARISGGWWLRAAAAYPAFGDGNFDWRAGVGVLFVPSAPRS